MPRHVKALALSATLIVGSGALVATSTASAAESRPAIVKTYSDTTIYPCNNGICTIGAGATGVQFAAALGATGGPEQSLETNSYRMSVASGSLPPGLRLALPDVEWQILGTPTKAGTYTFTIQIEDIAGGPDSFEKFSITIGAGSDNLLVARANYLEKFGYLDVLGFDVNVGATYTAYSAATGAELGTVEEVRSFGGEGSYGDGKLVSVIHLSDLNLPEKITVKDSLGGSVTVPLTRILPYDK